MAIRYIKQAQPRSKAAASDLRDTVQFMLSDIEAEGEARALYYAETFDRWTADVVLSPEDRAAAVARLGDEVKDPIRFAHDNIRRFAEAQKATLSDFTVELLPGHFAGQRQIPVGSAGCYVPGGRYAHVASALMTVTTAKVAGVAHVTAASPPRGKAGIPDEVVFAMDLAGADHILTLGGVQAVAAMALGLFGTVPADILAGPGNAFVAEAKRQLFGRVGVDMFAGPTDSLVIADVTADARVVAVDLAGQAEHGPDSPVWLVTDNAQLGAEVARLMPTVIADLPEANRKVAAQAWAALGEIMLCDTREDMAATADRIGPEHLHVQAADLDWWLNRLSVYGSLFLGAGTTVSFGDKASGPNHVLPTSGAARYTGGLSVQKFTKTVTWQRTRGTSVDRLAQASSAISRAEGMVGHALSAELRLAGREAGASDVVAFAALQA